MAGRIGLNGVDAALDSPSGTGGRAPGGRESMMASPREGTAVGERERGGEGEEVDNSRGLVVSQAR